MEDDHRFLGEFAEFPKVRYKRNLPKAEVAGCPTEDDDGCWPR